MAEITSLLRHIAFAALAFGAAGCATVTPVPTTVDVAGMPNPEMALQKSMQHVDAEMSISPGRVRSTRGLPNWLSPTATHFSRPSLPPITASPSP